MIVVAGTKLSQRGDQIAELTGLGGLWIGVVLMAGATSRPELLTTVTAALLQAPNLAAGNLFGAVMSNMLTLGTVDLLHRQKRVWQQAAYEQSLTAALAMGLPPWLVALYPATHGSGTVGRWTGYHRDRSCLYSRNASRIPPRRCCPRQQERERIVEAMEKGDITPVIRSATLKRASIGFALATLAIVVAAPYLAASAKAIADLTGIGTTFIGTSLVAITTSLPELVTSLAAIRFGAFAWQ